MAFVHLTVAAARDKMPVYSGTAGRLSVMVNATVEDSRVIFSGLTTDNFEITLWNPQGQALTLANNLKNLFVVETKEVPGVYALSLDWEAQDSRTLYGVNQPALVRPVRRHVLGRSSRAQRRRSIPGPDHLFLPG